MRGLPQSHGIPAVGRAVVVVRYGTSLRSVPRTAGSLRSRMLFLHRFKYRNATTPRVI
jgi:hypothetical protein